MKFGDDLSLLNFKIVVANPLIGRYSNCNRSFSKLGQASVSLMNHPWSETSRNPHARVPVEANEISLLQE